VVLAQVLAAAGEIERALAELDKVLAKNPYNEQTRQLKEEWLSRKGADQ
jgi:hypothetical protein